MSASLNGNHFIAFCFIFEEGKCVSKLLTSKYSLICTMNLTVLWKKVYVSSERLIFTHRIVV